MIRYLALTAAILFAISGNAAFAAVKVSLNILYNHPTQPSLGGNWTLVAKSNSAGSSGITAMLFRFNGMPAAGTVHPLIGHDIVSNNQLVVGSFDHDNNPLTPPQTEFVYAQEPSNGLVLNVGLPASPSNLINDPVGDNGNWGNSSVIATGSIANLTNLPVFTLTAANERVSGVILGAVISQMVVRTYYVVPEPTTGMLAMASLLMLGHRRRGRLAPD